MARRQDKTNADIAFGQISEGAYLFGFARERAAHRLEWLIETDLWRLCGAGYDDINAFLHAVWGGTLQFDKGERKKLALRIKELQAEASNRAIGHALGVDERTIRRDLSDGVRRDAASDETNPSQINGEASAGAASAALAAHREAVNAARGAEKDAPVGKAEIDAAFAVIDADPVKNFETLRSLTHTGALLWAHSVVGMGRRLRADKARFAPAQWFMFLDEIGQTEVSAEAFMFFADKPAEVLASVRVDMLLQEAQAKAAA